MSTIRNGLRQGVRSIVTGDDPSNYHISHFVGNEHIYNLKAPNDPKDALRQKDWFTRGRPDYNIQYMYKQGTKDPRNFLGQGYQETRQDGSSIQQALNNYMSDPNSPVFRTIDQYAKSLLQNGFKEAFDPSKRKRAKLNQTNEGRGPPGQYQNPDEATPGLPVMQLPYYTGEDQAYKQTGMKKNMFGDRAMENGMMDQVNTLNSTPGWYTMDKRLGIPTASGGFNVPNYNPETNQVEVRQYKHGFPTYMANPLDD